MTTLTVGKINNNLLDKMATSHEPIRITGRNNTAFLISEEGWRSIKATQRLLTIPKMRKSIEVGLKTPLEECSKELDW